MDFGVVLGPFRTGLQVLDNSLALTKTTHHVICQIKLEKFDSILENLLVFFVKIDANKYNETMDPRYYVWQVKQATSKKSCKMISCNI